MSVEQTRGRLDCGVQGVATPVSAERFRGVRIFDITDLRKPEAGGRGADLPRLAHAHAGARPERQGQHLSSMAPAPAAVRSGEELDRVLGRRSERRPGNRALQHRRDPGAARQRRRRRGSSTGRASLPTRPATSRRCGRAAITAPARSSTSTTNQCHDITVYSEIGLAAGACSGNGILMDITRSGESRCAWITCRDKNFAYWHSATFNNDGTKVVFTDEWGGGSRPRCRADGPAQLGRQRDLRHRRQAS